MTDDCRNKHKDLCESIEKKVALRLDSIDKATTIQVTELYRRLDILNHHQAKLKSFEDQFVRQDRYEARMENIDRWIESAKKDLSKLVVEHEQRFSKANWIAIFAVGVAVISFFYNINKP